MSKRKRCPECNDIMRDKRKNICLDCDTEDFIANSGIFRKRRKNAK